MRGRGRKTEQGWRRVGRKRTENAQCKVAEKCASRVRVRGRETRNAMEQCGVRDGRGERGSRCKLVGSVSVSVHADGESVGGVGARVASNRIAFPNETLCCAAGHASLGREFRIDPIPTIRSRLPFDSARFDVREIRPIE